MKKIPEEIKEKIRKLEKIMEINKKIEELEAQVEYEEKRLKYCGYGQSDLRFIKGLKYELEELEKMFRKMEEK